MVPTESSPRKSRALVSAALAVLVAGAGVWWFGFRDGGGGAKGPRYETGTVDRGNITSRVTATGTLSAVVTVQVGAQVTGRIAEILVDFNSPVKKGQLIARIDAQTFEAALAESKANLSAAQANHDRAIAKAEQSAKQEERLKELVAKDLVSQSEYDAARSTAIASTAEVAAAKSAIEQTKAAVERAQTNLGYTRILAPIDGVVLSRAIDVGQTVAASLQAPTLFTITGDLKEMQVEAAVAEADIGRVEEGKRATFTVDAFPAEHFEGVIRQVRNSPTTTQGVVTYVTVIDVDNADLRLKPGMTANVTFVVEERDEVLRVPQAALRYRPPRDGSNGSNGSNGTNGGGGGAGGAPAVQNGGGRPSDVPGSSAGGSTGGKRPDGRSLYVLRGDAPVQVRVKTGLTDGTLTEILEVVEGELKEGDTVVTGSLETPKSNNGSSSLIPTPMGPRGGGSSGRPR
ncbi:MAG: efflux RND transporter periplasmic adaptor subunit [Deltaproteobacteria bacterium]|nr:efflux RND transporter periplasmic adaptor subunit [Deltaproteobacteria bacterium]